MLKSIRWGGFGAFVAILALVMVIIYVFLDSWIKLGVEKAASDAVGAEVNIGKVQHSFSPFGIELIDIQVTDPQIPSQNKVQLQSVAATVSVAPLFLRKLIIDELSAEGVEFDTLRKSPGKVYIAVPESAEQEEVSERAIELPSVSDVLARTPLQTDQALSAAQASYQKHSKNLSEQFAALPSGKELAEYEQKIKALSEQDFKSADDFMTAQKQLKSLKDSLKKEKQALTAFTQESSQASRELSAQLDAVNAAQQADFNKLKGLVAGDAAAFGEMTEMLFGAQAKLWSQRLFAAYELVVPLLEKEQEAVEERQRADGRWVDFSETQPLPDVLIKKATLSLLWDGQAFSSDWADITNDHEILGRPTRYSVSSIATSKWQSLVIDGDFSFESLGLKAQQEWSLNGVKLSAIELSKSSKLSGQLEKALLSSSGKLNIKDGQLDGNGLIDLAELVLKTEGTHQYAAQIMPVLNQLKTLSMKADLSGTLLSPTLGLSSDLDKQLTAMLGDQVSAKGKARLDKLKNGLSGKAAAGIGESQSGLSEWQQWEKIAEGNTESVEAMLETQLENTLDKEKDKLEDQLRKRLFN